MKFAAAVALILVAVLAVWLVIGTDGGEENRSPAALKERENSSRTEPQEIKTSSAEEAGVLDPGGGEDSRREALEPRGTFFSGRAVDKETGEPVRAYYVELYRQEKHRREKVLVEPVRDEGGSFHFPLEKGGVHFLSVRSSSHRVAYTDEFEIPGKDGLSDFIIKLDPGWSVTGRVVEDSTSRPVAGALVCSRDEIDLEMALLECPEYSVHTRTDKEGRFRLRGLDEDFKTIAAIHPDHAEGFVQAPPGAEDIEIRLKEGFRVFGKVLDDHGRPAAGVVIELVHESGLTPVQPITFTGGDGKYITMPLQPGRVEVRAGAPRGKRGSGVDFTREEKSVELVDRDVEVDFGPTAGHVTWSGRLIDRTGLPVEGARVYTKLIERFAPPAPGFSESAVQSGSRCGAQGKFELSKLAPGRYRVGMAFPHGWRARAEYGEVLFENPGAIEKDIIVPGGAIRGFVVSAETGLPLESGPFSVRATSRSDRKSRFGADCTDDGVFVLRALPPGIYDLEAYRIRSVDRFGKRGLEVVEGRLLDNVRFEISAEDLAKGNVHIDFIGFTGLEDSFTLLSFQREGEKGKTVTTLSGFDADGTASWKDRSGFKTGSWTLRVKIEELGIVDREFRVYRDETTGLTIYREDFIDQKTDLTIAGSLVRPNGEPVPDARLFFKWFDNVGNCDNDPAVEGVTDEEGRFVLSGFRSGKWKVRVALAGGGDAILPPLEIDPNGSGEVRLVLPGGVVSGALIDGGTGRAFGESGSGWSVTIFKINSPSKWTAIATRTGAEGESRFEIAGLSGGEYAIDVRADGFFDYMSETFSLKEGGKADLGRIRLEPAGFLTVVVVDSLGRPIESANVKLPDLDFTGFDGEGVWTPPNRFQYSSLPVGKHKIYVIATGYKPRMLEVELFAGKKEELRVSLEPL